MQQSEELRIIVRSVPPSVNHYVRHSSGRHYKTPRAESFAQEIGAMLALHGDRYVTAEEFEVELQIAFCAGLQPDADNMAKIPLDALQRAGVFRSPDGQPLKDSSVKRLVVELHKSNTPETLIIVRRRK